MSHFTTHKHLESSYLRAYKAPSIPVENVRQISLFLQNKPNSPIVQMNLTFFITMIYIILTSLTKVKNKPNSNPNKPNFKIGKINLSVYSISEYKKYPIGGAQKQSQTNPKTKPISSS